MYYKRLSVPWPFLTLSLSLSSRPSTHPPHLLTPLTQRDELVKKHKDLVALHEARIEALIKSLDRLNNESTSTVSEQKKAAAEDLMTKYAKIVHEANMHPLRRYALQFRVGRPWDGFGGAAFEEWKSRYGSGKGGEGAADDDDDAGSQGSPVKAKARSKIITSKDDRAPSRMMELTTHDEALDCSRLACMEALHADRFANELKRKSSKPGDDSDDEEDFQPGDELCPEYTWDDTELMQVWQCDEYDSFKRKTGENRIIEDVCTRL